MLKSYLQLVCVLFIALPIMSADLVPAHIEQKLVSPTEINSKLTAFMEAASLAWEKNQEENKQRDILIAKLDTDTTKLREKVDKLTKENRNLRDGYVKQLSAAMLNDLRNEKNLLIAKTSLVGAGLATGALMTAGLLVVTEKFQDLTDNEIFKSIDRIGDINGEIKALEISAKCAILDHLRRQFVTRYKAVENAESNIGSFRRMHTDEDEGRVTYHVSHEIIAAEEQAELRAYESEAAYFETYKNNFNKLVSEEYEKLDSED